MLNVSALSRCGRTVGSDLQIDASAGARGGQVPHPAAVPMHPGTRPRCPSAGLLPRLQVGSRPPPPPPRLNAPKVGKPGDNRRHFIIYYSPAAVDLANSNVVKRRLAEKPLLIRPIRVFLIFHLSDSQSPVGDSRRGPLREDVGFEEAV